MTPRPFLRLRQFEEPFQLSGERWLFVTVENERGEPDIGVYRFASDLCFDYMDWRRLFNLS